MNMNNVCDIFITPEDHEKLMAHLFQGDLDEHGAVLRAGFTQCGSNIRLYVQHVEIAKEGMDYQLGKFGFRALNPSFIHRQIVQCRDAQLAYLAVHNHDADESVNFSAIDMESHERGYPALLDIGNGVPVGALVFGRRSVAADIWLPSGTRKGLGSYRVIGKTIKRFYSNPKSDSLAHSTYDRQIRMFGVAGQEILRTSKIAVVGLGGIGSLVTEYLARLGVGHLVLIDHDQIENTNISRVVGATNRDIEVELYKTEIAVRHVREIGTRIVLDAISKDVTEESTAKTLLDCDFIFLAADSMRARLLVNALAHQYYIPTVQLGAKVKADSSGSLEDSMCAIRHLRPGKGCLWCNGFIDKKQLAIEQHSDEARVDYAYGIEDPNPSVITLNSVAAAHAVNDFLFDFLDLRSNNLEVLYQHHHFLNGKITDTTPRRDANCSECNQRLGKGDAVKLPTILDKE